MTIDWFYLPHAFLLPFLFAGSSETTINKTFKKNPNVFNDWVNWFGKASFYFQGRKKNKKREEESKERI